MSLEFYKILHLIAVFAVLSALSIRIGRALSGFTEKDVISKTTGITHGVALVVVFVSGFGLIARLGYQTFPSWIYIKLVLFALVSLFPIFIKKNVKLHVGLLFLIVILFGFAAYVGVAKP
ncbi:MAG: SirB2 family protein [Oligoflexales bacterium]|nr:SirB2 family protein [Oligoflexales bacterium]